MSNARIQFSLASEDVWNAYNPQLKEGEIVTVLKANKKVKLVQGKVGGSTYSESTVIWDEDLAETTMSRAEAAAVTATAQAAAASGSASKAAASQSAAATSATNAKASETAAKTSATSAASSASSASTASTQAGKAADSASASKEAAQSAATTASNYASAARSSASEAKAYMDTTKDLSENVNVFVPTVDADGTLTWTNKAGLSNPAAVNIKGAKGDPGPQGPKGDEVTIDEELSATSVNPVQNKIVKVAIDNVTDSIPKTSIANTWTARQNFYNLMLSRETYSNFDIVGGSDTPITSTMIYPSVTSTFTLNLSKLAGKLRPNQTTVFTAYFIGNGNYPLIITDAGIIKYIGSASDVAVTPYGMLLNILMVTDGGGILTSIVQASKLEGGA